MYQQLRSSTGYFFLITSIDRLSVTYTISIRGAVIIIRVVKSKFIMMTTITASSRIERTGSPLLGLVFARNFGER